MEHKPGLAQIPIVGSNCGSINPSFPGVLKWGVMNVAASPLPPWGPLLGDQSLWVDDHEVRKLPKVESNYRAPLHVGPQGGTNQCAGRSPTFSLSPLEVAMSVST